jgi:TolA-binding protein
MTHPDRSRLAAWLFIGFTGLSLSLVGCAGEDRKLYSQATQSLEWGNFDQAVAGFSRLVKEYPRSERAEESLYRLGEIYFHYTKNPEKAMEYFSLLVLTYPEGGFTCVARQRLVDLYLDSYDEEEKAAEECQKILVHCPDRPIKAFAQKRIADGYFKTANYQQALIEYQTCEREFPDPTVLPTVQKKIGDCYYILGEMDNAEVVYRKILKTFPDDENAEEIRLTLVQILLKDQFPCLALDLLSEVLAKNPARTDLLPQQEKTKQLCETWQILRKNNVFLDQNRENFLPGTLTENDFERKKHKKTALRSGRDEKAAP